MIEVAMILGLNYKILEHAWALVEQKETQKDQID